MWRVAVYLRPMDDGDWIAADDAARYLGRTARQLRRYAESGRVRKRVRSGRTIEYYRPDIERIREETPPKPESEAAQLAALVRELTDRLTDAARREGELRARLAATEAERDKLAAALDAQNPKKS